MEKIENLAMLSVMVRAELTGRAVANPSPAESTCNVFMMSYVVLQQKHLSDTVKLWLSSGYCNKEDQHFVYSIIVVH